jgi:DNA-directed RNA polymerase III subunit RPC4
MPPRGARAGARGAGRGGRGGRGGAPATASGPSPENAPPQTQNDGQPVASLEGGRPAAEGATARAASSTSDAQGGRVTPSGSRQSATPGAAPSRGGLRFKPKNVRRDASERQRLEDERNRDLSAKIKAEEREQRAEERRARRARGRGDAMSQRGIIRRQVTASGPFSAIPSGRISCPHQVTWFFGFLTHP